MHFLTTPATPVVRGSFQGIELGQLLNVSITTRGRIISEQSHALLEMGYLTLEGCCSAPSGPIFILKFEVVG